MKLKALIGAGVVAGSLACSSVAGAAVLLNRDADGAFDGTGFVGKGDVQLAFGWSNKQAQANANGVAFDYAAVDTYDVTCEWETVTGGPNSKTILHDVTNEKTTEVRSAVAYDARLKNQYTGYNLTGPGDTTESGTVPVVGGTCPQAHASAVITEVDLTSSTGGLTVTFNGTTVPLPDTPTSA